MQGSQNPYQNAEKLLGRVISAAKSYGTQEIKKNLRAKRYARAE